ncbi:MAG: RDD family protein [Acidimicrobiales bacterium]
MRLALDAERSATRQHDLRNGALVEGSLASVGQRVVGGLVDLTVAGAVLSTPFMLLAGALRIEDLSDGSRRIIQVLGFIFLAAYTVIPTALSGRTVGKLVVGTAVVRRDDGGIPGWRAAALRWALPALAWRIPTVGWLAVIALQGSLVVDPLRRGLHDRLSSLDPGSCSSSPGWRCCPLSSPGRSGP